MTCKKILTLLTDFGSKDAYVGILKGTIACINSHLQIIDLTHQIPPQNVAAARFCLANAYAYFPEHTVHVAVVDPGVGSQRRGIAVKFAGGFLVGPDNGLFSGVLADSPAISAFELTNSHYWRSPNPSSTFHGRDIFAPAGAYLASGVAIEKLGQEIEPKSLVQLPLPKLQRTETEITGCIQYIDRFGNLITNIPADLLVNRTWSIKVKERTITKGQTYSDVGVGEIVALIGSHGWLEIGVRNGNAREKLQLDWGSTVMVFFNN